MTLHDFIIFVDERVTVVYQTLGEIQPMWHAVTASGEHRILPSPDMHKDTAAILMREYFKLHDVKRYVFIDEAWQLETPVIDENEMREIARRGLEHHPDRIEVLSYQAEDDSGLITAQRVITRLPSGKGQLGRLEFTQSQQSEGRLVGMLPVKGTVQ